MERLRILQVADHAEIISGGAMQMLLLARGLVERGHEVTCVFDDRRSPLESTLKRVEQVGAQLVRLPMHKKARTPALCDLARNGGFDVVHTHRAAYKVLLRSAGHAPLPPVIVNRGHSRAVRERERDKLLHPAIRGMVVVAAAIRDVLVAGGIPRERIHVVYGSYPDERFNPGVDGTAVRGALLGAAAPSAKLVGVVAKLSAYKSHDVFLEAAARVLRQEPDTVFALVGPDAGGVQAQLEGLAERLGAAYGVPLRQRLRFTGPRQDIPEVLAALDVSVSASASAHEGLSGAMRETLAMRRPAVCTDVGGNRELIRHRETGLLVPPGDARALADAIVDLLRHPETADRMAAQGRRLVEEMCSNAARARIMEQLYRRILEEVGTRS